MRAFLVAERISMKARSNDPGASRRCRSCEFKSSLLPLWSYVEKPDTTLWIAVLFVNKSVNHNAHTYDKYSTIKE